MTEPVSVDRLSVVSRDLSSEPDEPSTVARAVELGALLLDCAVVDILQLRPFGGVVLAASTDRGKSNELIGATGCPDDNPALLCRELNCSAAPTSDSRGPIPNRYVIRFLSGGWSRWTDADVRLATAFADLAALAIDRSALRSRVENLALGLESNRLIGTAVGILMAHHRVTYDQAFDLLRVCSQDLNRKLRQVAEDVVRTGELPDRKSAGAA